MREVATVLLVLLLCQAAPLIRFRVQDKSHQFLEVIVMINQVR